MLFVQSGSKLFGGKGKDTPNPGQCLSQQWGDMQSALDLERKRNAKLMEQVERLRQENFQQQNECMHLCISFDRFPICLRVLYKHSK